MFDLQDRSFPEYDTMADEALQQILRADASGEDPSDTARILYITQLLASRRQQRQETPSTVQAWDRFQTHYMPPAKSPWQKRLATAAVLALILLGGAVTVGAFRSELWSIVAVWTDSTFYFIRSSDSTSTVPSDSPLSKGLQEALERCNISAPLVPRWFPEGYQEDLIWEDVYPKLSIVATYTSETGGLSIHITEFDPLSPGYIERDDSPVETYHSNGTDYYIFSNGNHMKAAWIFGRYRCTIAGPITREELKTMIDSIH